MMLILTSLCLTEVNAQVSLSLQEPPAGVIQKNQLWNIALIYSGSSNISVTINVTLVNSADNQPVLTAVSSPVTLSKGIKQLKLQDVSPINYNYFSIGFNRLSDGLLPVGRYRACYTVMMADRAHGDGITEDCINLEVLPLSPPQLNLPGDSDIVNSRYPQFSWMPPVPLNLFTDLNYEFLLTEVRNDQTAGQAIQENIPVMNISRNMFNTLNYPASSISLDTGKVYAWRVIAKNGDYFAAQSEVWTFSVASPSSTPLSPAGGIYYELKPAGNTGGTGLLPDRILGIKYYSYEKERPAVLSIVDGSGKVVKEYSRKAEYGNNFWIIELGREFKENENYRILIADLQGNSYSTSFRIQH